MSERVSDASEKSFQAELIRYAKDHGWLVFHTPPFAPRHGVWRSAGKGFPDLCLVDKRGERGLIFAELKTEKGKLSPEQEDWGIAIIRAGFEWRLWRPSDWPEIAQRLM